MLPTLPVKNSCTLSANSNAASRADLSKKVVIYTPTFSRSAGTRYRVEMMQKALSGSYNVQLICDKEEVLLREIYKLGGPYLLSHNIAWKKAGKRIANIVAKESPDVAILMLDAAAGAIPQLQSQGIRTILSVEGLTPEWLDARNSSQIYRIFTSYAKQADGNITVSHQLRERLSSMGIESAVIPIGLGKIRISREEALARLSRPKAILHAGQIQFKEELDAFGSVASALAGKCPLWSYSFGRYAERLRQQYPGISWYNYQSEEDAVGEISKIPIGLIIRFRAYSPSRLFFNASMLQPVIAIGNDWVDEVKDKRIGVVSEPSHVYEAAESIMADYPSYVSAMERFASENILDRAYAPLIRMIGQ